MTSCADGHVVGDGRLVVAVRDRALYQPGKEAGGGVSAKGPAGGSVVSRPITCILARPSMHGGGVDASLGPKQILVDGDAALNPGRSDVQLEMQS